MASFSSFWRVDLAANPGSKTALPGSAVAPPWTFSRRPCSWRTSRSRRIGHVGHAEHPNEVGDADCAVLADALEDQGLALSCKHVTGPPLLRSPPAPSACSPDRASSSLRLADNRPKVNVFEHPDTEMHGCAQSHLTSCRQANDNPCGPVGLCSHGPDSEEESVRWQSRDARFAAGGHGFANVSRRAVLKGMAGVAGIAAVPALLAACSTAATAAPSTGGAASQAPASAPAAAAAGSAATGSRQHRAAITPTRRARRTA